MKIKCVPRFWYDKGDRKTDSHDCPAGDKTECLAVNLCACACVFTMHSIRVWWVNAPTIILVSFLCHKNVNVYVFSSIWLTNSTKLHLDEENITNIHSFNVTKHKVWAYNKLDKHGTFIKTATMCPPLESISLLLYIKYASCIGIRIYIFSKIVFNLTPSKSLLYGITVIACCGHATGATAAAAYAHIAHIICILNALLAYVVLTHESRMLHEMLTVRHNFSVAAFEKQWMQFIFIDTQIQCKL